MDPIAYVRTAELLKMSSEQAAGPDPRLKPAAHAFEASLIQELLKPMQHDALFSDAGDGSGGGGVADGGMDTVNSLSLQALAQAISNHGGFGIADQVLKEVKAQNAQAEGPGQEQRQKAALEPLQKFLSR